MATYALIGLLIGTVLGLTGAGGGIFAIPLLMFFAGVTIHEATPIALFAVSIGAAVGTFSGLIEKTVRYRAAFVIALAGLPTSYLGINVARSLPHDLLIYIFALVMVWVAWTQIRKRRPVAMVDTVISVDPNTNKFIWTFKTATIFVSMGAGIGFLTGLLGVGGGFIIVPLLRKLTPISMRSATATSLMVITLVTGQTILGHLVQGEPLPLNTTMFFTVMTVLGLLFARRFSASIPENILQRFFALMLVLIALLMIWPSLSGNLMPFFMNK